MAISSDMAIIDSFVISPTIVELLMSYRYWFVALGMVIADVPTLLVSGYFISQGHLAAGPTLLIAIGSRGLFDLLLFYIGKYQKKAGDGIPFLQRLKQRSKRFIDRHKESVMMTYHFIQGIKLGAPIVFGMSTTSPKYFATLNIVSLLVWTSILLTIGAIFGAALI